MSVSCRATDAQRGFTLIEMLVALAIVAAVAALVAPSSFRALMRTGIAERRLALERALIALPDAARSAGRPLQIGGDGPDAVASPPGWRLEAIDAPIRYRFDGVCAGGRLRVVGDGAAWTYRLAPPYCVPVLE